MSTSTLPDLAARETTPDAGPRRRGRAARLARRAGRAAVIAFAVVGVVASGAVVAGAATDIASFDRTSGGYEPPYTGWTGTPIDWSAGAVTSEGFRNDGLVVDTLLDCTTGMISFETFGIEIPFRTVSERAVAVHKPVEACEAEGFTPDFVPSPGA